MNGEKEVGLFAGLIFFGAICFWYFGPSMQ